MTGKLLTLVLLVVCGLLFTSCSSSGTLAWDALDQASRYSVKRIEVDEIQVPDGFRAVRVAAGLNFPSAFTWDAEGNLYVIESHTVPVPLLRTRIVRIGRDGKFQKLNLSGAPPDSGTAIGLTHHGGWLYFTHAQARRELRDLSRAPAGGAVEVVVPDFPTQGDHDVNKLVFDRNGSLYFGVGSASNSGVIARSDYVNIAWLEKYPQAHDFPCRAIQLTTQTFTDTDGTITGPYQALGQARAGRSPR